MKVDNPEADKAMASIERHIGKRLRDRRIELGITQEELAATINVSYQQIQKYEIGANRLPASRLHLLAKRMDVPMQFFFDSVDDNATEAPQIEHGGRQRATIEAIRASTYINDQNVKVALSGLIKAVVARQDPVSA